MVECYYCRKPAPAGSQNDYHDECRAEFERRRDAGKCIDCGKAKAKHSMTCAKCLRIGLQFRNYPGGAR